MASDNTREFLVVGVPAEVSTGTMLRLLAVESTLAAANKAVDAPQSNVSGRVAVLQRKAMYDRRPRIESVEVESTIISE